MALSDARALTVRPIGYARTPLLEKRDAPRQGTLSDAVGTIELDPSMEHAVEDLAGWQYIWILYWFDRVEGWRPKVRPPRSAARRGVLSTRSPHRPNPIGMTVAELLGVDGLSLRVSQIDLLDGTPVIDIKPYVPYSDAFPDARCGWLDEEAARVESKIQGVDTVSTARDPHLPYRVTVRPEAEAQLAFVHDKTSLNLRARVIESLAESPEPRPYRRIRRRAGDLVLAVKEWRVVFAVEGREVHVLRVESGFRREEIAAAKAGTEAHAEFLRTFGGDTST